MIDLLKLAQAIPADVIKKISLYDIDRITKNYNKNMKTLYLKFHGPTTYHKNGYYEVENPEDEFALRHFNNGGFRLLYEDKDEFIYVAGLHGWSVVIKREAGE